MEENLVKVAKFLVDANLESFVALMVAAVLMPLAAYHVPAWLPDGAPAELKDDIQQAFTAVFYFCTLSLCIYIAGHAVQPWRKRK